MVSYIYTNTHTLGVCIVDGRCCCGVGYRYHVITNEHTIHVPPNHNDNKEKQPTEDMGEYRIRQIHLSEYKYDIYNQNRHRHETNQKKTAPFVRYSTYLLDRRDIRSTFGA